MEIIRNGSIRSVLERHAVQEDLYSNYAQWVARYDSIDESRRSAIRARIAALPRSPRFSLLLFVGSNEHERIQATIQSVLAQLYENWELMLAGTTSCSAATCRSIEALVANDPRCTALDDAHDTDLASTANRALTRITGEYLCFLVSEGILAEHALFQMADAICKTGEAALLYSDEDRVDARGGRHAPHFKPDWNPEWLCTKNYLGQLTFVSAKAAIEAGGLRQGLGIDSFWDLLLRVSETARGFVHVSYALFHRFVSAPAGTSTFTNDANAFQQRIIEEMLGRRGIAGHAEQTSSGWKIRYSVPSPAPRVSIVVPTRDHADLLKRCVGSLRSITRYPNYELLIVDNESRDQAARRLLARLANDGAARVIGYAGEFNFAAECNVGVLAASGSVLVLLNNDIEIIEPQWLSEMVGHALQPNTGVVGALLLYPNDSIQHAGIIIGVNGTGDHPYRGYPRDTGGLGGRWCAAHNVSAVTAACMALRSDVYRELGGMDESLRVAYNDSDLCLRAIRKGYRNVWTPHAVLRHLESASRGYEISPAERERAQAEAAIFFERWSDYARADPTYNENLALRGKPFSLAFPPRHPHAGTR